MSQSSNKVYQPQLLCERFPWRNPFHHPKEHQLEKFENSWQFLDCSSICPQLSNWLAFFKSIVHLVDRIAHCACFLSHCAVLLCILLSYFYDWNGWHWAKLCIASTGQPMASVMLCICVPLIMSSVTPPQLPHFARYELELHFCNSSKRSSTIPCYELEFCTFAIRQKVAPPYLFRFHKRTCTPEESIIGIHLKSSSSLSFVHYQVSICLSTDTIPLSWYYHFYIPWQLCHLLLNICVPSHDVFYRWTFVSHAPPVS